MVLSPLATHEARASTTSSPSPIPSSPSPIPSSPSPVPSPDNGSSARAKFFERGVGTQVMLANVSAQAKQLLYDKARRVLSGEDVKILKEDLIQVSQEIVEKLKITI